MKVSFLFVVSGEGCEMFVLNWWSVENVGEH